MGMRKNSPLEQSCLHRIQIPDTGARGKEQKKDVANVKDAYNYNSAICSALLIQEVWPEKGLSYSNNAEKKELLHEGCTLCSHNAPELVYSKEQPVVNAFDYVKLIYLLCPSPTSWPPHPSPTY
eukprot:10669331-Ditylum_brightwellii.AAC.1